MHPIRLRLSAQVVCSDHEPFACPAWRPERPWPLRESSGEPKPLFHNIHPETEERCKV
jgi:hypothetical protein